MNGVFYGISREDEEAKLQEVSVFASERIKRMKGNVNDLQKELGDLRDVYDLDEKEGLALWFNKDARYQQVRQDLLRAERCGKKPYFGRIDFEDSEEDIRETFYIGKTSIGPDPSHPVVLDWRAPVASAYYEMNLGECKYKVPYVGMRQIDLKRKRTYEIDGDKLVDYYDTEVVANDELLTKYLSKNKQAVLSEIIATIQQEQNEVIRKNPHHNVLIQGSAGSGKTTVAMHRISYILYNFEQEFPASYFYIIGSNKVLLNYITGVLPDLDVYDINQMTMEEMLVSLLHDEWDRKTHTVRHVEKSDISVAVKGTDSFYRMLTQYVWGRVEELIDAKDIRIPQTGHILLSKMEIRDILHRFKGRPLSFFKEYLTDLLMDRVEQELLSYKYMYDIDESRKATMHYKRYFKRLRTKKSVFELYEEFLKSLGPEKLRELCKSAEAAIPESRLFSIPYVKDCPDLYDLAALAYLQKSIKEEEPGREACHVVIDEAQDFGIAVYESLKYCLDKCTYTIMGDVAQNINFGCGMGDWEALKELLLPDPYDYFGILKKSYRNTIEISDFANNILKHGTFPLYPVEPILRHGDPVEIRKIPDEGAMVTCVLERIRELREEEYETIAVICADSKEVKYLAGELSKSIDVKLFSEEDNEFTQGVTVLPIEYAKGLEFDAVIISDASSTVYPYEDRFAKLLYVASTRALHDLTVLYTGELTGLIADPIPEGRKNPVFKEDSFRKVPRIMEEDFRTKAEIAKDTASEGDKDMRLRDLYGPRRVEALKPGTLTCYFDENNGKVKSSGNTAKTQNRSSGSNRGEESKSAVIGYSKEEAVKSTSPKSKSENVRVRFEPTASAGYSGRPQNKRTVDIKENSATKRSQNSEFGMMSEGTSILPPGHGNINNGVRWISVTKSIVRITGYYGLLCAIPLSEKSVKIVFSRSLDYEPEMPDVPSFKWNAKEGRDEVEIDLGILILKIDKKSGSLEFRSKNGQKLLSENSSVSRQYHDPSNSFWEYLSFKKEILKAYNGVTKEWIDVSNAARYITTTESGGGEPGVLVSMKGYQIEIPPEYKVMLCSVASNSYLKFENSDCIEYIFTLA